VEVARKSKPKGISENTRDLKAREMYNIRELSIGSIVTMREETTNLKRYEVLGICVNGEVELHEVGNPKRFCTNIDYIEGAWIHADALRNIGFVESDEKAWQLMYYFGDTRLYWKYDKKKHYSIFKFKPDFTQKQWVRIECAYIHSLQNIMRFLTGGELEFKIG
jgi:hypothetical protein